MIPKIIHQTWKNKEIPLEWMPYVKKVKQLNPEWDYKLWTDNRMQDFVEEQFPDFVETYLGFPKNVMRADAFRYLLIYKIGGVYLDLDYEVLKPFDFKGHSVVLPFNRQVKNGDKFDGVGNCIFASVPGHPFWLDVIQDLKKGRNRNLNKKERYTTLEEETTGPAFLTRVVKQNNHSDIFKPDRLKYHPPTPKNKIQIEKIKNNGISVGIHHCAGSWRERSLIKQFLTAYKRVLDSFYIGN